MKNQMENDVRAICFEGGRMAGSNGSARARKYLLGRMREIGLLPYGKTFDLPYQTSCGKTFHNLVGVVKGKDSALPPLLVGAHYDSVIPAECADDNAAAVAIAISVAEELRNACLPRDIVIAIFDAEEPPYFLGRDMGSVRFFKDEADKRGFNAALIMDLVGHDVPVPGALPASAESKLRQLLFVTGAESAPDMAGMSKLETRSDMDRMVGFMKGALNV